MRTVNVHEAKTHFSKLLALIAAGDEVLIAKAGRPIARLVPADGPRALRRLGALANRVRIPVDFDAPLPDTLLDSFEGAGRAPAP